MSGYVTPQVLVELHSPDGDPVPVYNLSAILQGMSCGKPLKEEGTFQLMLAPRLADGTNVIRFAKPMSLIVISVLRLTKRETVMVGFLRSCVETEQWTGSVVQKSVVITGSDFHYMFTHNYFFTLSLLGYEVNGEEFNTGSIGLAFNLTNNSGSGGNNVPPDQTGKLWFNKVMAGPGAIMSSTVFRYNGVTTPFYNFMATIFEQYPFPVEMPFFSLAVSDEVDWYSKFFQIFPFPWYELIVTTADVGTYRYSSTSQVGDDVTVVSNSGHAAATPFKVDGAPDASPILVARVNPLPKLTKPDGAGMFGLDMDRWNALKTFSLDDGLYKTVQIGFDSEDVRNFYVVTPVTQNTTFGDSGAAIMPWLQRYACWIDTDSIHRYGYRTQPGPMHWMQDPDSNAAEMNADGQLEDLSADISLRMASMHEPSPLMAKGSIATVLRPDIRPGFKFEFKWKQRNWLFYIDSVVHVWQHGSDGSTILGLSRGLPVDVYNDLPQLIAIHAGKAAIVNGAYVIRKGAVGLQELHIGTIGPVVSEISAAFARPSN